MRRWSRRLFYERFWNGQMMIYDNQNNNNIMIISIYYIDFFCGFKLCFIWTNRGERYTNFKWQRAIFKVSSTATRAGPCRSWVDFPRVPSDQEQFTGRYGLVVTIWRGCFSNLGVGVVVGWRSPGDFCHFGGCAYHAFLAGKITIYKICSYNVNIVNIIIIFFKKEVHSAKYSIILI